MEIAKVRKQGLLKIITIPKKSNINIGDYVKIHKILTKEPIDSKKEEVEVKK